MNRANRMTKLSLVSAMSVTGGFASSMTLDNGLNIDSGGVMVVANGEYLKQQWNRKRAQREEAYVPGNSEAIDVRVSGSLVGASGQTATTAPAENSGGTVNGLVIRHHARNWVETANRSGIYVPQFQHGFVSKSLTLNGLREMFDEGGLQTIYRNVSGSDQIAAGKTILLTTGSGSSAIGVEEQPLADSDKQLKPTQNVTFGSTVVINNFSDETGIIRGNLANRNFVSLDDEDDGPADGRTVALPNGYTYASGLQLIGGSGNKTLTLSGDNHDFAGSLSIGDGTTTGVVYIGANNGGTGNPQESLGNATNITVNPNAGLYFRGSNGVDIETKGNWDIYYGSKLTLNKRIVIKSGHTITLGKTAS